MELIETENLFKIIYMIHGEGNKKVHKQISFPKDNGVNPLPLI